MSTTARNARTRNVHFGIRSTLIAIWTIAVAVALAVAIGANWRQLRQLDWRIDPGFLALALALGLVRKLLGGIHWGAVMAAVTGEPLRARLRDHVRVYVVAGVATYLPGTYWFIPGRVYMNRKAGFGALETGVALVLEQLMIVLAGLGIAALYLQRLLPLLGPTRGAAALVPWLAVAGLVVIHPRVLAIAVRAACRVLGRPARTITVGYAAVLRVLILSITVWLASGASLYFAARSIELRWPIDWLTMCGVFAISWLVGFATPFAPAGLGVREGVMVALLAGLGVAAGPALVLSVLSRLVIVFEDVVWYLAVRAAPGGR
jgi:glycosyltransferase 2 family protein